jgi:hypothetical protein
MPGCVLRAWGDDFEPETFLQSSAFNAGNVFRKGERKYKSRRAWDTSGITIVVSESFADFSQQVVDAIEFLRSNRVEILRLQTSDGLEGLTFDFGVDRLAFCKVISSRPNWFVSPVNFLSVSRCRFTERPLLQ